MRSQKQMLVLSLYGLLAGILPWIAAQYHYDLETIVCGRGDWTGDYAHNPQFLAWWHCSNFLHTWILQMTPLIAFSAILVGIISLGLRKSLPHKHITLSLLGSALGLGFLLTYFLTILIFLMFGGD